MRFVKIGALALALILIGTAAFLIVSDRLAQPAPPDPASLIAKAVQYHVRIECDHFGVPQDPYLGNQGFFAPLLLRYLVSKVGKPVPHRELLQAVWSTDYSDEPEHLRVFVNLA
jgi:hypothetical protein